MYKLTLVLGLLSSAFAVETTTLLLLGFDKQSIVASIISSDSTATTYGLACPSSTDASDCGVPPNFIFTQGPSTMHYDYSLDADDGSPATVEANCQITTDHGMCTSQYANAGPSMIGGSGSAFPYSNYGTDIGAQAVTIVGDAAAPGATGSTSVASTSATTTSSAPQQTESSGSSKTSSGSSTATSSQTGSSSSTKVSTGGMPMITGHPQWIIGGAAAAVAFAAM